MTLTIKLTKDPADFHSCAQLMCCTEPWITLGRDYKTCLKAVRSPMREVYAARAADNILGFIILEMTGTLKGYIKTVCVAPEARGLGVGTKMVRFAEKRIFRESPNVFMCVSSFNKGARRLYKRLGYSKTGTLKDFIVKGHDELLLRKTIGPTTGYKP
ncbi:MAG: N-acetyltransferase [Elusimicrobiota bacterium]